jgi:hypothetical protein
MDPYLYNVQLTKDLKIAGQAFHVMVGYQFVPWVTGMLGTVPANYSLTDRPRPTNSSPVSLEANGMVANMAPGAKQGWIPDLKVVEALVKFDHKVAKLPFAWTFHMARNTNSFDLDYRTTGNKVRAGKQGNANAYFVKVEAGNAKVKGDAKLGLQWGYIEPNAVLGLYSDSDSGTGFNNQKWLKADIGFMLTDALSLNVGQYAAKRVSYELTQGTAISNKNEASSRSPLYRTQLDFIVKL